MKIVALTPEDELLPDLDKRLAALHAMGPMEFEPGERAMIAKALDELDSASKKAMEDMAVKRYLFDTNHNEPWRT